ncbi:MAG: hypothetical protein IJ880_13795 [Bacilli bacterium]|nr:hypothetical protein [Bacilli bacterium]
MAINVDVRIYPYPLTNLVVKSSGETVELTDSGNYYYFVSVSGLNLSLEISCDEYVTKNISFTTIMNNNDICVGNLYAWTSSYGTAYTASVTPAVSDTIYNADGIKITSISNGSDGIDWSSAGGLTAVSSSEITITGDRM